VLNTITLAVLADEDIAGIVRVRVSRFDAGRRDLVVAIVLVLDFKFAFADAAATATACFRYAWIETTVVRSSLFELELEESAKWSWF